jgi:hypothetical protein
MERINVRVTDQLKRDVVAEARRKGVRPSDIVREVLEEHMKKRVPRRNCRELADQIGLIGSVEGLPEDLSTSRDHLARFGGD